MLPSSSSAINRDFSPGSERSNSAQAIQRKPTELFTAAAARPRRKLERRGRYGQFEQVLLRVSALALPQDEQAVSARLAIPRSAPSRVISGSGTGAVDQDRGQRDPARPHSLALRLPQRQPQCATEVEQHRSHSDAGRQFHRPGLLSEEMLIPSNSRATGRPATDWRPRPHKVEEALVQPAAW